MDDASTILSKIKADWFYDASAELNSFQQRPNLLDLVLPDLVETLANRYLESQNFMPLHTIYVIARVRGYKFILPHFPVRIDLVSFILDTLESYKPNSDWQAEFVLLLWASCLLLAPFDLKILGGGKSNILQQVSLVCERYLSISGVQRDAAALLMARTLTHNRDQASDQALSMFLQDHVKEDRLFAKLGTLQVLAAVMDRVKEVPSCVKSMISNACDEKNEILSGHLEPSVSSPLAQVLWTKIVGRAALLEPETYAEFAIETFLDNLNSKSSKLRTSAAKYLGRIAKYISYSFKDDDEAQYEAIEQLWNAIYEPIYETNDLSIASSDHWGGALFALAEVIRSLPASFWASKRGRSLLNSFSIEVLQDTGLHFIQPKLQSQGGANVRDTACYVCWSIFRYVTQLELKTRDTLFSSLKALSLLDNEIQIRRAAAAALQEGLGRHSQNIAPQEAFRIMEKLNFSSVSSVSHCYTALLPTFWEENWVSWFLLHGCYSPDISVRGLAAQTIGALVPGRDILVKSLLKFQPNSTEELEGQCRALFHLFGVNEKERHRDQIESMIRIPDPQESELAYLAMLHLSAIYEKTSQRILQEICFESISQKSLKRNEKFPSALLECASLFDFSKELANICASRIGDSPFFVQCLKHFNEKFNSCVGAEISRVLALKDSESRAIGCQMVSKEEMYLLLPVLDDYSQDKRGDIGSWVRESALKTLAIYPDNLTHEYWLKIWRLAAEGNEMVRSAAGALFTNSKELPDIMAEAHKVRLLEQKRESMRSSLNEINAAFFYVLINECPEIYRGSLMSGIITSLGVRAPSTTAEACMCAIKRSLPTNPWIIEEFIRAKREYIGSVARYTLHDLIRAFQRLAVSHCREVMSNKRVMAIAFNITLARGHSTPILLDAIDILEVLSHLDFDKIRTRLLNIVKTNPHGIVRQRAADAVFELDLALNLELPETFSSCVESDILPTSILEKHALVCVAWKRSDWQSYIKYLK